MQEDKDLTEKTKLIIDDQSLWEKLSHAAKEKAKEFSLAVFEEKINNIIR
jgi:hypothetical protein